MNTATRIHRLIEDGDLQGFAALRVEIVDSVYAVYSTTLEQMPAESTARDWLLVKRTAFMAFMSEAGEQLQSALGSAELALLELQQTVDLAGAFAVDVPGTTVTEIQAAMRGPAATEAPDFMTVVVSREEVEACDIGPALAVLNRFRESPEFARRFRSAVDLRIDGYNDFRDELFEIIQVRNYINELDLAFPYWLYFLSKDTSSLQMVTLCFLPPFLTEEGKREHFGPRMQDVLSRVWIPAFSDVAAYAGLSEAEHRTHLDEAVDYFYKPSSELLG